MDSIFNHIHAISRNIQNTDQSTAFKTSHKTHICTHTHTHTCTAKNVNNYIYKKLKVHIANILSISSSRKTYVYIYILCRIINTEDIILPQYSSWKFGRSKIWSTFWYSRCTTALFGSVTSQHYQTFVFADMSVCNLVFYTQSTSTVISG